MEAEVIEKFDEQFGLVEGTPVLEDISSVYVRKDSIQDILSLNTLSEEVANKGSELAAKEAIIDGLKKDRNELAEEIIRINDTQNIQEADTKLTNLHDLDKKIKTEEDGKEEIYASLTSLKNKYADLEASTKKMVDAMTEEYNAKAKEFTECTVGYIEKPSDKDYEHIHELAADLADYKKYNSFEDIYTNVEDKEEEKTPEEEKKEEAELAEVKVDSLPEAQEEVEIKEQEVNAPVAEETSLASTPVEETVVDEPAPVAETEEVKEVPTTSEVEMPSFTDLLKEKEQVSAPVAEETPLAPTTAVEAETKEESKPATANITLLTGDWDKIANSTKKGADSTRKAFESAKVVVDDKTLALAA